MKKQITITTSLLIALSALSAYSYVLEPLWAINMGYAGFPTVAGIVVDSDGNSFITGQIDNYIDFDPGEGSAVSSNIGNRPDIYLAKYCQDGTYITHQVFGNREEIRSEHLFLDKDESIFVIGSFYESISFGTDRLIAENGSDIFVSQFDKNVNSERSFSIGGPNGNDYGKTIAVNDNGDFAISGISHSTSIDVSPGYDSLFVETLCNGCSFLVKYNSDREVLWANAIDAKIMSLEMDNHGNVYIAGIYNGTITLETDTSSVTLQSNGLDDLFFAKYTPGGEVMWAQSLGAHGVDHGLKIYLLDDSIIIGGRFSGTVNFDLKGNVAPLSTSERNGEGFVACYSKDLNLKWVHPIGAPSVMSSSRFHVTHDRKGNLYLSGNNSRLFVINGDGDIQADTDLGFVPSGLAVDNDQNLLIAGSFSGTVDFNPGSNPLTLTSNGPHDIYIVKYDVVAEKNSIGKSINSAKEKPLSVKVANRNISVNFMLNRPSQVKIEMIDPMGKLVYRSDDMFLRAGAHSVALSATASGRKQGGGLYILRYTIDGVRGSAIPLVLR
ncbi:hypothetical protein QA601_14830 [Chitinispirillales bacterium ANBcel5]|uniref:hypothetical protein n=1 Tax=Cellulosispirillum alkaliphilum TaxID=3039283 RepID=UPI002A51EFD3|nr:hypothetical protein [Chitinispirillales bacterium ANBcel5]